MARPGDVIESPATGERVTFRRTAAETRGELLEIELLLAPRARGPFLHAHPLQSERFEVVVGTARVRRGWRRHTLVAGESIVVPAGALHRIWNDAEAETRARIQFRPALNTETFFENAFAILRERGPVRGTLELVALLPAYRDEMSVPAVLAPIVRAMAALGRALGHRPRHPVAAWDGERHP